MDKGKWSPAKFMPSLQFWNEDYIIFCIIADICCISQRADSSSFLLGAGYCDFCQFGLLRWTFTS